jgi:hypothetical protein
VAAFKTCGNRELHCQWAEAAVESGGGWGESEREGGALLVTLQAAMQYMEVYVHARAATT